MRSAAAVEPLDATLQCKTCFTAPAHERGLCKKRCSQTPFALRIIHDWLPPAPMKFCQSASGTRSGADKSQKDCSKVLSQATLQLCNGFVRLTVVSRGNQCSHTLVVATHVMHDRQCMTLTKWQVPALLIARAIKHVAQSYTQAQGSAGFMFLLLPPKWVDQNLLSHD